MYIVRFVSYRVSQHVILTNDRISQRLGGINLDYCWGVQITREARKLITDQLVNAVELTSYLSKRKRPTGSLTNWVWHLRSSFDYHKTTFDNI